MWMRPHQMKTKQRGPIKLTMMSLVVGNERAACIRVMRLAKLDPDFQLDQLASNHAWHSSSLLSQRLSAVKTSQSSSFPFQNQANSILDFLPQYHDEVGLLFIPGLPCSSSHPLQLPSHFG